MFDLAEIEALGSGYSERGVVLSGMTYAVLLSCFGLLSPSWKWNNGGQSPTQADRDRIDEIVDGAMVELMQNQRVGEIICYAGSTPQNVLPCDGSSYVGTDYPELFALLDPVFISGPNFATPDLRGRGVIGSGSGSGLTGRSVNDAGGEESHVLTTGEMPSHSHGLNAVFQVTVAGAGVPYLDIVSGLGGTTNAAGGGGSHNNMQPFRALNYGIVAR